MSRFTLDSATQFLFGSCVHSLSAQLPYAENSPRHNTLSQTHTSDNFAAAFTYAQHQIALRGQYSDSWPLAELWKDKTRAPMKVIYDYIDPILKEALAKKDAVGKRSPVDASGSEQETLLSHLVNETDGEHCNTSHVLTIDQRTKSV
jgi:hypothetical protein